MKGYSRDLLLLSKSPLLYSEEALEREVRTLQGILLQAESMGQFCIANEIIDVNRYRIISQPSDVRKVVLLRRNKPFVFINCKN